jgi:transcriptional regulator with XRE-family HTH domain
MTRGLPMLTKIREAKGYSLRTLADKVGMSYVALFRLERGETDPRLGTLQKLAKALHATVAELIGEGKPARKRARREGWRKRTEK